MKKFNYSIICPCGYTKIITDTFQRAFGNAYAHESTHNHSHDFITRLINI